METRSTETTLNWKQLMCNIADCGAFLLLSLFQIFSGNAEKCKDLSYKKCITDSHIINTQDSNHKFKNDQWIEHVHK